MINVSKISVNISIKKSSIFKNSKNSHGMEYQSSTEELSGKYFSSICPQINKTRHNPLTGNVKTISPWSIHTFCNPLWSKTHNKKKHPNLLEMMSIVLYQSLSFLETKKYKEWWEGSFMYGICVILPVDMYKVLMTLSPHF